MRDMPYQIKKVRGKSCYRVTNKKTGKLHAKCTTMKKAQKQVKLMNALEYNPRFVPRNKTVRRM